MTKSRKFNILDNYRKSIGTHHSKDSYIKRLAVQTISPNTIMRLDNPVALFFISMLLLQNVATATADQASSSNSVTPEPNICPANSNASGNATLHTTDISVKEFEPCIAIKTTPSYQELKDVTIGILHSQIGNKYQRHHKQNNRVGNIKNVQTILCSIIEGDNKNINIYEQYNKDPANYSSDTAIGRFWTSTRLTECKLEDNSFKFDDPVADVMVTMHMFKELGVVSVGNTNLNQSLVCAFYTGFARAHDFVSNNDVDNKMQKYEANKGTCKASACLENDLIISPFVERTTDLANVMQRVHSLIRDGIPHELYVKHLNDFITKAKNAKGTSRSQHYINFLETLRNDLLEVVDEVQKKLLQPMYSMR